MDLTGVDWSKAVEFLLLISGLIALWIRQRINNGGLKTQIALLEQKAIVQQEANEKKVQAERIATMEREALANAEHNKYFFEQYKDLRKLLDDTNTELGRQSTTTEHQKEEIDKLNEELETSKIDRAKLHTELEILQALIQEKDIALAVAADGKLAAENRAATLEGELADLKKNIESELQTLRDQLQELQQQVAKLNNELAATKDRAAAAETQLRAKQIEIDNLTLANSVLHDKIIQQGLKYDGEIKALSDELRDTRKRLDEFLSAKDKQTTTTDPTITQMTTSSPTVDPLITPSLTPGDALKSQTSRKKAAKVSE